MQAYYKIKISGHVNCLVSQVAYHNPRIQKRRSRQRTFTALVMVAQESSQFDAATAAALAKIPRQVSSCFLPQGKFSGLSSKLSETCQIW